MSMQQPCPSNIGTPMAAEAMKARWKNGGTRYRDDNDKSYFGTFAGCPDVSQRLYSSPIGIAARASDELPKTGGHGTCVPGIF
ncbi:hypothetical protein [Burkholderia sp. F1]|uniref:hypothetical protein n=1 Tax=Burkholderia sp. F1 TaxID=3366817 RepID=UPI003D70F84A